MQSSIRGVAAFSVVGVFLALGCGGGGGGGEGDLGDPTNVAGTNGGTAGQKSAGGAAAPSSAAGAAGTASGAPDTASGSAGTASGAAGTASGTAGTASGAAGTASDVGAPPAADTPTPSGAGATTAGAPAATTPAGTGAATTAAKPAASTAAPAAAPAGNPGATIVPLYTYPTDPSWNTVIAAKAAHPRVGVIAAVNPANGPGAAADPSYASGIARLNAAGIRVIGYVATGYAVRNPAEIKADIDRWQAFYPGQIGGIFFDEQSNRAGDVAYYRDISQYAKSKGMAFTVGNPGTDSAPEFVGALDTMLIYEAAGLPSMSQLGGWHASHAASNFGVIPHAAQFDAAFVREARKHVQYIYIQNDTLPNPWDSVPATFGDLLAALE